MVTRLGADRIWGEPCAAFQCKGDCSIKPWLRIMVSLQEDVKLDCSYKVLAEDKPVLSNYPPKLHQKMEGVESWQHCCPRLKIQRRF